MRRAKRKQPERRQDCDFPAVALKGAIEQNSVGAYFGSWGALAHYCGQAVDRGWLERRGDGWSATDAGMSVYETSGLADLPRSGRGYAWNWNGVRLPMPEAPRASEVSAADQAAKDWDFIDGLVNSGVRR